MISYRTEHIPIAVLVRGVEENYISLKQEGFWYKKFELGYNVWPKRQFDKQMFITSIFAGMPVYPLTFAGTTRPWQILAGMERLDAIMGFCKGEFAIAGSKYLPIKEKTLFEELPFPLRRRFETVKIPCFVINPPCSWMEIEEIKKYFHSLYD